MSDSRRSHLTLVQPSNPERPMQAMMLAVCNCYMLWALFWAQFLTNFFFVNSMSFKLDYYIIRPDPLGIALPEFFLFLSIGVALFAMVAVAFGTRETPKLWRRLVMVAIFSAITVGYSTACLCWRGQSYDDAIRQRDTISQRYQELLKRYPRDEWIRRELYFEKRILDLRNKEIERFQELYGTK